MSLPFYLFNCTSCNLERRFFFDTAYKFADTNNDGHAPSLQVAWCDDCDKVVTSSNPQTQISITNEVELRSKWIAEEEKRKRSLFHPFRSPNKELIKKLKSEIDNLQIGVDFFRHQKIVPRCLSCGGENITPIELPDSDIESTNIGVRHYCGGEVCGVVAGRIRFGDLPVVTYDIKGHILSDERESNTNDTLEKDSLNAVIGLAGNVSSRLLDAAQLSDKTENIVHPEFSILGVYLSVREYFAINELGGNAVNISAKILTRAPYINSKSEKNNENIEKFKNFCLSALRNYDREANRSFGDGPSPWSTSKESQDFGKNAFQILLKRLQAYPDLDSIPFTINIEDVENEIAKQPEILSTAFNELKNSGEI